MIELIVLLAITPVMADPGITPDNPLYFLDLLFDELKMFIASLQGVEALARAKAEVLNERLAELYAMATANKTDKVATVLHHVNSLVEDLRALATTHPHVASICMQGLEVAERVLNMCMDICPEEAKYGLQTAIENIKRGKDWLNETIHTWREQWEKREQCRECWRERVPYN